MSNSTSEIVSAAANTVSAVSAIVSAGVLAEDLRQSHRERAEQRDAREAVANPSSEQ